LESLGSEGKLYSRESQYPNNINLTHRLSNLLTFAISVIKKLETENDALSRQIVSFFKKSAFPGMSPTRPAQPPISSSARKIRDDVISNLKSSVTASQSGLDQAKTKFFVTLASLPQDVFSNDNFF
jgi:hypothetical protein